jgi:hypothetical protein
MDEGELHDRGKYVILSLSRDQFNSVFYPLYGGRAYLALRDFSKNVASKV